MQRVNNRHQFRANLSLWVGEEVTRGNCASGGFPFASYLVVGGVGWVAILGNASQRAGGILPIAKSNILDNDDSIAPEWVV